MRRIFSNGGAFAVVAGPQHERADADFAGVERGKPVEAAQERRFAAAARAEKGHGLARLNGQTDLIENQLGAVPFGNVFQMDRQIAAECRTAGRIARLVLTSLGPPTFFQVARQIAERHTHEQIQGRGRDGDVHVTA